MLEFLAMDAKTIRGDEMNRLIPDDCDRLLSIQEVAERLGTNDNLVRKLIDMNLLSCIRFGRYRRVRKVKLNEFLEKHDGADLCEVVGGG